MAVWIKENGECGTVNLSGGNRFERSELERRCGFKPVEIVALGRLKKGDDIGEDFPVMDGIRNPTFVAVRGNSLASHERVQLNKVATEIYKRHGGDSLLLGNVVILSNDELPLD